MRQFFVVGALVALGGLAAVGCMPPEDSCDVKTEGIRLELAASEEAGTAKGQAILWTDEGRAMVLGDCGDKVTVNGVELEAEDGTASPIVYSAAVDATGTYEFVFSRPDEDDYVSTVTDLRPAVAIDAPEGGAEVPRDEPLAVTWSDNNDGAGDGQIAAVVTGDCIDLDYEATWSDDGEDEIPADSLDVDGETTSCQAELVLTREVEGTLDADLNQTGSIKGWSVGRTTFTTVPTIE
jgi:hypothetical protein